MMHGAETVGEAWLRLLAARGVDMLFANSGTDFPSIVEGLARAEHLGVAVPRAVLAPHENAAMGMAHGYALVTGRAQAVMVHVNVGTANAVSGLQNAERDYVPLLLAAGRTPILEGGRARRAVAEHPLGAGDVRPGQLVREFGALGLRAARPAAVRRVTDRALAIAHSAPRGPVYLTLPREILAMPPAEPDMPPARLQPALAIGPDPAVVAAAVAMLARAQHPLIITARAGADRSVPALLSRLAARLAAPVVEYRPRHMNLSTDDTLHGGFEVAPWLAGPMWCWCWIATFPGFRMTTDCAGRHDHPGGEDPLQARYVSRGFPADLTLRGSAGLVIMALLAELGERPGEAGRGRAGGLCRTPRADAGRPAGAHDDGMGEPVPRPPARARIDLGQ